MSQTPYRDSVRGSRTSADMDSDWARTDYVTKRVPGRAYLFETPRVIYYTHCAHTGDKTHVSQATMFKFALTNTVKV
jgi:hypothetical protein